MRSLDAKRGRLLTRFHSVLCHKSVADLKADPQLLSVVLDQYKQAMVLLYRQATDEEKAIRAALSRIEVVEGK